MQVRAPRGQADVLADLEARCGLVLIDAPCTGTGTWRRHPDAKWRIAPGALEQRIAEQRELLDKAPRFVKPGGRIVYVTCSLLRDENEAQIARFLEDTCGFFRRSGRGGGGQGRAAGAGALRLAASGRAFA